jgi:hypothetical protein
MSLFSPGYIPNLVLARKAFIGSNAAGAAITIPIYSGTTPTFGLWNPAGSGVNVLLLQLNLGIAAEGSAVASTLGFAVTFNTGSAAATGSPLATFTRLSSGTFPSLIGDAGGATNNSAAQFSCASSGTTLTSAATLIPYNLGASNTAGASPAGALSLTFPINGMVGLAPGTFISLVGNAAPVTTFYASLVWAEVPAS